MEYVDNSLLIDYPNQCWVTIWLLAANLNDFVG